MNMITVKSFSHQSLSIVDGGLLTALCLDAETVFKAFVWVGAGDDLWVGAAHVHVSLALDDIAAIALQPTDCGKYAKQYMTTC